MRVLITGSRGQVGTELTKQAVELGWDVQSLDHAQVDITDIGEVQHAIRAYRPDVAINAAAYTAVDRAESNSEVAFAVNRNGPANLAKVCAEADIPLVHYSTDYVFDGSKQGAYSESDRVVPLGVYGESKLAGEESVRLLCSKHLILRTSWVFSPHGHNFVKSMLRLASEREDIGVVADQFGKPTSATEIARVTLQILSKHRDGWGVYHLAQPDATSWYGFAQAVFATAKELGETWKMNKLNAISTSDYPTQAKRPANSVLNCNLLESVFDVTIRPWRESLAEVVEEIVKR